MKLWAGERPPWRDIYIYTQRLFFNVHTHVPIYIMSVGTLLSTELLHTQSIQATLLRWVEVFDRGSMACVDDRILPVDIGQPRRLWFYLLGWLIDSSCGNVFVIFYASAHGELSGNEHPSATRGFVKTRLQHRHKPCKDYLRGLEKFFNRSLSRQRNIAQGQSSHLIRSGMMQEVNELPRLRGNGTKWSAMIGEWDSLGMSGIRIWSAFAKRVLAAGSCRPFKSEKPSVSAAAITTTIHRREWNWYATGSWSMRASKIFIRPNQAPWMPIPTERDSERCI